MSDATPVTVVIGSGPTGFAAAHRLVKLGYRPIVLDGGTTLDTDRRRMADRLAAHPPAPLSEADSALLTGDRATVRPFRGTWRLARATHTPITTNGPRSTATSPALPSHRWPSVA